MTRSGRLLDLVLFFEFGGCLGAGHAVPPGLGTVGHRGSPWVRTGQRRTNRSSQLLLVSRFAVPSTCRTARRRRSLPRRNSLSVRWRIVVSAWRNVSTWPRKSARLVGYLSRTCSSASWWNPAAANALHVSSTEG